MTVDKDGRLAEVEQEIRARELEDWSITLRGACCGLIDLFLREK